MTPDDPQFTSPDGRYHWDGQSWVAVPPESAPFFTAPVAQILPTHQVAKTSRVPVGLNRIWREQPLTVAIGGLVVGALVASVAVVGLSPTASHPGASPLATAPKIADAPAAVLSSAPAPVSSSAAKAVPVSITPAPIASSQAPTTLTLTGELLITEAIDTGDPTQNPTTCMPLTTNDMQVVIADASGTVVGVSGDPSNPVMSSRDTSTTAFIANCTYTYTVENVPASGGIDHLTITGDLTNTTFSGFAPVHGEYIQRSAMLQGDLPKIIADIKIGVG